MTVPENHLCHLAQDLLIPYLAAEVRPETIEWMNRHLGGCSSCRAALAELTQGAGALPAPAPPPRTDPGQRLIGRVRRHLVLIIGAAVCSLALAIGSIAWGVSFLRNWEANPENHPAPAESVTPEQAAEADLSPVGLTRRNALPAENGQVVHYQTAGGQTVTVGYYKLPTPSRAREEWRRWERGFRVKLTSVGTSSGTAGAIRFRSGGNHYQGWYDGRWFFTVQVPDGVDNPAALRDAIKAHLTLIFAATR